MARPREFKEVVVLDAATDRFWRDGYEATSVRDLATQMGITGTSLYNAFGDKHSVFREVLRRYAERSTRERIGRLEATLPPKQAVCAFLGEIVERSMRALLSRVAPWRRTAKPAGRVFGAADIAFRDRRREGVLPGGRSGRDRQASRRQLGDWFLERHCGRRCDPCVAGRAPRKRRRAAKADRQQFPGSCSTRPEYRPMTEQA